MTSNHIAAFIAPIVEPVMMFVGLLVVRWIAVIILRILPDGPVRQTLFDKQLFERRPWLYAALFISSVVAFYGYASTFS